ncbi:MAG TPA: glutamate racemase [Candidatus Saccharimonadales bacterium]|nr:glutamate racemase [Candidatus Saccharimonadales bacterium]
MKDHPIGIFDSGVGGLSILASVKSLLPKESFVYLADQANYPYGGRSVGEIEDLSSRVISFLLQKNVKLVIVACNTVSSNAIDYLRAKFNIPIIAVVPVVKTISQKSKTKKAAVLSTPATAKSKYLSDLIAKFSNGTNIYIISDSKLEHLVEEGIITGPKVEEALKDSLNGLLDKKVDSIALGCTHYPFLTPEIKKLVGSKIAIYDSGGAIARRTEYVLVHEKLSSFKKDQDYFYTTGDSNKFKKIAEKLVKFKLDNVESVQI